jgi:amino acid adenylation domain-containing protein
MLGVLKAGGAYLPLDPLHPHRRLAFMLADARPKVVLTQARLEANLPPHVSQVLLIDAEAPASPEPAVAPDRASESCDLAYVIYTSGSTGEPKGVQIEHRSVANMLASMLRRPGLRPEDRMLALTTLTFDIAVLEIFLPLVCGASAVIAPAATSLDGDALMALLERTGVNIMQATPATLRMLLDAGWEGAPNLRILCGGEAWNTELANQLMPRCGALWNMYGPTETTVWSAIAKVEPGQPVVIGAPIANTRLYVLDGAGQLLPVGVAGELCIGGEGLARGYFQRPELTRERFVPDRFSPTLGARMYRTGDLVRRLPDGMLEFLGRLDHQVKIRGHRIELGEIETALGRHPMIEQCVVIAREDEPGDQRLVAYFVATDGAAPPGGELRALLGETLPGYMIPSNFVPMAAFPLTPNGKLDRKALPTPEAADHVPEIGAVEPRTPTEEILARIWREMLGLKWVGVRDNFFELGGHSLLAARMIGRINQTLNVRLPVPAFFQNPTIEGLARVLGRRDHLRPEPQLLTLQSGNRGLPVYFIGAGPAEIQIAQLMGEDRAVFAIDIPMPVEWRQAIAEEAVSALPTLEELGELYSDLLRDRAGSAPCVVAGYSLWGKIAFEAARALRRAGGDVAFVLLLDARAVYRRRTYSGAGAESWRWIWGQEPPSADRAPHSGKLLARLVDSARVAMWMLARVPKAVKTRLTPDTNLSGYIDKQGVPIYQKVINGLARMVGRSYRPTPLDAPGVLIRARFPGEEHLPGYDFTNGWGDLFEQGLEIIEATGDHVTMVDEENLKGLADLINAKLERYSQAEAAAARGASVIA